MAKSIRASGRMRLEETLSRPALAHKDKLKDLVRRQILKSSISSQGDAELEDKMDMIVEKHLSDIWDTLQLIRSASDCGTNTSRSHGWKLKQDSEQIRVMYREGPEGTPFHMLLAEGFVDGPIDTCMCLSLEPSLYPHWFPQITFPAFKVLESRCLKKIRVGEEISLVRMKLPWPLTQREIILQYFELEYFEEDSVIILLKSVPNSACIDEGVDGFSSKDIPAPDGSVRIDVLGGFFLQKVNSYQSYFRTIANLDIKLDFVPTSLINFVSRQLIGYGFTLYQQAVTEAAKGDELCREILAAKPMYIRVRGGLQELKKHVEQEIMCEDIPMDKQLKKTDSENMKDKETYSETPMKKSVGHSHVTSQATLASTVFEAESSDMGSMDPAVKKALRVLDDAIIFAKTLSKASPKLDRNVSEASPKLDCSVSRSFPTQVNTRVDDLRSVAITPELTTNGPRSVASTPELTTNGHMTISSFNGPRSVASTPELTTNGHMTNSSFRDASGGWKVESKKSSWLRCSVASTPELTTNGHMTNSSFRDASGGWKVESKKSSWLRCLCFAP